MSIQTRSKRFLAVLLALVLAFTSMNFNTNAYADEIEESATEVLETSNEEVEVPSEEGFEEVVLDEDPDMIWRSQIGFYTITDGVASKLDSAYPISMDEAYANKMEVYAFIPTVEGLSGKLVGKDPRSYSTTIYGDGAGSISRVTVAEDENLSIDGFEGKFIKIIIDCVESTGFDYYIAGYSFGLSMINESGEEAYGPEALGIQQIEITSEDVVSDIKVPYIGYPYDWDYMSDILDTYPESEKTFTVKGKEFVLDHHLGAMPIDACELGTYKGKLSLGSNFSGDPEFTFEIVKADIADTDYWKVDTNDTYCDFTINPQTGNIEIIETYAYIAGAAGGYISYSDISIDKDTIYVKSETGDTYEKLGGTGKLTKDFINKNYNIESGKLNGTFYLKVTGKNNAEGEIYCPFVFSADRIYIDSCDYVSDIYFDYNGKSVKESVKPVIKYGNYVLEEGVDYILNPDPEVNWTDASSYYIALVGKGLFYDTASIYVTVNSADISNKSLYYCEKGKAIPTSVKYSDLAGKSLADVFKVWDGDKELVGVSSDNPDVIITNGSINAYPEGCDYIVDFTNKAGSTTLTIYGCRNYTGKITRTINVKADKTLTSKNLKLKEAIKAVTYTGNPVEPDFELVYSDGKEFNKENCDITYSNNVNAGTATITVTGAPEKGYSGTVKFTFKINKAVIGAVDDEAANVWLEVSDAVYKPAGAIPLVYTYDVSANDGFDFTELEVGKDFTIACTGNKAVTTETAKASFTITGTGNFTGTVKGEYIIHPAGIAEADSEMPEVYISDSTDTDSYAIPEIKLSYLGVTLKEGVDYTWNVSGEYAENLVVKDKDGKVLGFKGSPVGNEYTIVINGKGNFNSTREYNFIVKDYSLKDISDTTKFKVELENEKPEEFIGQEVKPVVKVTDIAGDTLLEAENYTVFFKDAFNAGTASVVVIGNPERGYCGSVTLQYKINPKKVEKVVTTWNTSPVSGDVVLGFEPFGEGWYAAYINDKGKLEYASFDLYYMKDSIEYRLANNKDYTYKYVSPKAINGADVVVEFTFKGNFTGKVNVTMGQVLGISTKFNPNDMEVTGIKDLNYTGKALKQSITVKDYKNNLTFKGKDLNIRYYRIDGPNSHKPLSEITEAGIYRLAYLINSKYMYDIYDDAQADPDAGDGYIYAYKGKEYVTFEVKTGNIAKADVKLAKTKFNYNYNDVSGGEGYKPGVTVKFNKAELVEGKDYEVQYINNRRPGTATVNITGKGNFVESSVTKTFTIEGKININDCIVEVAETAAYSPAGALPAVVIKYNDEVLASGKDYTLSATDNKAITKEGGKLASLTIKGKGKYTGTLTKYNFKVVSGDLEELYSGNHITFKGCKKINGDDAIVATYSGKKLTFDPKVCIDGKQLKLGKDYSVSYFTMDEKEYDSLYDAGLYYIAITGKGNYTGKLSDKVFLIITSADASKMKVKTENRIYTGMEITDSVVSVTYDGKKLVEGVDYLVYYDIPMDLFHLVGDEPVSFGKEQEVYPAYLWEQITGKKVYMPDENRANSSYAKKYKRSVRDMNESAGKTAAYVVGIGNFMGLKEAPYTINGYSLSKAKVSISTWDLMTSSGGSMLPEYKITYKVDKDTTYTLKEYKDFKIDKLNGVGIDTFEKEFDIYKTIKNGTNTVTLSGVGRFSGSINAKFKVKGINLSEAMGSVLVKPLLGLEPMEFGPVPYNPNGATVSSHELYVLNKMSPVEEGPVPVSAMGIMSPKITFTNNKALGTRDSKKAPTVKLSISYGAFSGSITGTFDIVQADVSEFTTVTAPQVKSALDSKGFVKTYKSTPVVKYYDAVKGTYTNTKLKAGKDYTVSYQYAADTKVFDGKNWVIKRADSAVGASDKLLPGTTLKVVITGKGNYCGCNDTTVFTVTKK